MSMYKTMSRMQQLITETQTNLQIMERRLREYESDLAKLEEKIRNLRVENELLSEAQFNANF